VSVQGVEVSGPRARYSAVPPLYFLFLLVPLLSVVAGGRLAARRGARLSGEAGLIGAAAGVVFAALVLVGSLLASLTAGGSVSVQGLTSGASVRIGPDIVSGFVLALAWGVVGGLAGGKLESRRLPREGVPTTGPELPPPSPPAGADGQS
jgi:hypothetical protein